LKPYQDITDPKLAKALAHPLRTRLLSAMEGRTASPSELADELGAPLGVVSYHVRRLTALGFVKLVKRVPRRGAVEHYYTVTARPRITDSAWGATPSIVKEATIKATLGEVATQVNAAAASGGFDAGEAHLSRSPVTVDAEGFSALAKELSSLTDRIRKIESDSKKRLAKANHASEQQASVVLMLFNPPREENGRAPSAAAPAPARRRRTARAASG
jgi:DNA-binding transcriptional ArsR family regulator